MIYHIQQNILIKKQKPERNYSNPDDDLSTLGARASVTQTLPVSSDARHIFGIKQILKDFLM